MANTYNAVGKYFDIDSADVNVDGLAALKGSDPAADDLIYTSEDFRTTVDRDMACKSFYTGDNYAGTAAVKTGHVRVTTGGAAASVTLTLHTATIHKGFEGEGTTSTIELIGTSDTHRAIVTCNTVDKVTNYYMNGCVITSNWGEFRGIYAIYGGAANSFPNTLFDNCYYDIYFDNTIRTKPTSLAGAKSKGSVIGIYDGTTTLPIDWGNFFTTNEIKFSGTANGSSGAFYKFGASDVTGISRYQYLRFDADSITTAPEWDTTEGIQTLTAEDNCTLTASWNGATHGTGDAVRYRIYVRAGAAPDSFGVSSEYYLGETADTTFVLGADAAGAALVSGTTYHAIVRAATALSDEDENEESLSAEAALAGVVVNINTAVSVTAEVDAIEVAVKVA